MRTSMTTCVVYEKLYSLRMYQCIVCMNLQNYHFNHIIINNCRKSNNRVLTISKKELNQTQASASSLKIIRNSRQQIFNLLQRFPLTAKERQELMPQMERNQAFDSES